MTHCAPRALKLLKPPLQAEFRRASGQMQRRRTRVLALWNLRVNHSPMTLPSAGSALRSYTYLWMATRLFQKL